MIISRSRGFAFVHVPKCGGTRFRYHLHSYNDDPRDFWGVQRTQFLNIPLDFAHLRAWELQIFFPDVIEFLRDARSVCFFRNPVDRFVSAVFEHYAQHRPEIGLAALSWSDQQAEVRRFTAGFELDQAFADFRYVHFSPQTWFTHLAGRRVVKTIIPMIDGFDAFRAAMILLELPDFLGNNRPARPKAGDLLGRSLVDRVRAAYEADYQFCSAHDHLRALTLE